MNALFQILDPDFVLRNAVHASLLVGLIVPLAGIHLVLGRRALLALALPEAGGAGVAASAFACALMGADLSHEHAGALPFFVVGLGGALLAMALALGLLFWLDRRTSALEAEAGAVFALAFGLTLALSASNRIPELGLLDLLKGEILAVSGRLLFAMAAGMACVAAPLILLRHRFEMVLYDARMAYASGLPARGLGLLSLGLVCVTIALGGLCAGPLTIFAFLVLPAVTVLPFARRMRGLYLGAPLLGLACAFGGFYASFTLESWNLPVSAAQIVLLGFVWLFSRGVLKVLPRKSAA